jgi:hypothetical protein
MLAKLPLAALLMLPAAGVAFAQQPDPAAKQGDYYSPSKATGANPTPQDAKQAKQGDYYPPGYAFKIPDERYAAIESCAKQSLDKYPDTNIDTARSRHFIYEDCMTRAGLQP